MNTLIMYYWIHQRLLKDTGGPCYYKKKDLCIMMSRMYHTPKKFVPILINDMVELKMIKDINKDDIEILPIRQDIEKNCNKIYHEIGIF